MTRRLKILSAVCITLGLALAGWMLVYPQAETVPVAPPTALTEAEDDPVLQPEVENTVETRLNDGTLATDKEGVAMGATSLLTIGLTFLLRKLLGDKRLAGKPHILKRSSMVISAVLALISAWAVPGGGLAVALKVLAVGWPASQWIRKPELDKLTP